MRYRKKGKQHVMIHVTAPQQPLVMAEMFATVEWMSSRICRISIALHTCTPLNAFRFRAAENHVVLPPAFATNCLVCAISAALSGAAPYLFH